MADSQQKTLLRLASEGISVYSPHTAVDAAPGGLGDWLADVVTGNPADPAEAEEPDQNDEAGNTDEQKDKDRASISSSNKQQATPDNSSDSGNLKRPTYMLQHHPSQLSLQDRALNLNANNHRRQPIQPSKVPGYEQTGAGMGRVVHFSTPQPLLHIIDRIGLGLGNPKGFPIAIPQGKQMNEIEISSVAICAGSGGSVFRSPLVDDVDLLFTGELSHHEALAAIESGKCVIALFHSNTERGFLHSVMKPALESAVRQEVSEFT